MVCTIALHHSLATSEHPEMVWLRASGAAGLQGTEASAVVLGLTKLLEI